MSVQFHLIIYVLLNECRWCYVMVQKSSGDFPTVLYEVISKRSSVIEGSLTVDELNDILDELAQNMGKSHVLRPSSACPSTLTSALQRRPVQDPATSVQPQHARGATMDRPHHPQR